MRVTVGNAKGLVVGGAYWLAVGALMAIGGAMMLRSYVDVQMADRQSITEQSSQLAEAGVDYAVKTLGESDANWVAWPTSSPFVQSYANGQFSGTVGSVSANGIRDLTVTGTILRNGAAVGDWSLCGHARRWIPSDLYDHVLISADSIVLNGSVLVSGGEDEGQPANVTGKGVKYGGALIQNGAAARVTDLSPTRDPAIDPLPLFDLDWLRNKAKNQGNYYDAARLKDVEDGDDRFPINFYYIIPVNDPITGDPIIPGEANVVFIEGALDVKVNGSEIVGGFFVVPDQTTISRVDVTGNATFNGVIYTLGQATLSGTAQQTGAIWAGGDVTLSGTVDLVYNKLYADAVRDLNIPPQIQLLGYHRCQ